MGRWRIVYEWTRAILAGFGLIAFVAAGALAAMVYSFERQYERRAAQVDRREVKLEDAELLLAQAGVGQDPSKRLLAGMNPVYGGNPYAEAYCVEARVESDSAGWQPLVAMDPFLVRAVEATLALASAHLDCIPTTSEVRERGLELKLISLNYGNQLETVRLAVRDPMWKRVYVVAAWRPGDVVVDRALD